MHIALRHSKCADLSTFILTNMPKQYTNHHLQSRKCQERKEKLTRQTS